MSHTDIQKDPAFKAVFKGFDLDHRWEEFIAKLVDYVLNREDFAENTARHELREVRRVARLPDEGRPSVELEKQIKMLEDRLATIPNIFWAAIAEAERARKKFPKSEHLVLALAEEAGEVTKAALDQKQGKVEFMAVRKELIQTVAMCLRLAQEGDPTVNLPAVEP